MGYNEKRNLSIAIIAVFTLVCVSITGASYAFFVATVTGTSTATNIKTADLKATYSDGAAITGTNIVPGWSATKTISIENTGTYSLVYTIKWVNVTNGGMTDLKYSLTSTSTGAQANVSNVAAIIIYEALRQQNFPNLLRSDPFKGEDYLKKEDGLNQ